MFVVPKTLSLDKTKEKRAFLLFCARLFHKIFTFEKTNILVFFSLTQIFRTFVTWKRRKSLVVL